MRVYQFSKITIINLNITGNHRRPWKASPQIKISANAFPLDRSRFRVITCRNPFRRYGRLLQSAQYWHSVLIRLLPHLPHHFHHPLVFFRRVAPISRQPTDGDSRDWLTDWLRTVNWRLRLQCEQTERGKRCHFYCTSLVLDNSFRLAVLGLMVPNEFESVGRNAH